MSLVRCICIDDTNRPKEIPPEKWIKSEDEYRIIGLYVHLKQNKIQGVTLVEKPLDESCAPYSSFRLDRFRIRQEDIPLLIQLAKDCSDLQLMNDADMINLEGLILKNIEVEEDVEARKYLWTLCFGGKDGNEVYNIASVACSALAEKGQYTREEIAELREIQSEIPAPDFSYGNCFERQDRLIAYSKMIRSRLKKRSFYRNCIMEKLSIDLNVDIAKQGWYHALHYVLDNKYLGGEVPDLSAVSEDVNYEFGFKEGLLFACGKFWSAEERRCVWEEEIAEKLRGEYSRVCK